ncbi:MAG: hybrid sensor histidine kinase/response regulator, partial [Deltaproteobacteria bacterium]
GVDLSSSVRIHVDILDKLMMLVGELVLVRNQQILSMENADPVSQFIAQRLDAVTTELQETVMRTRMQSIGKIFRKFPRIIRTLGKAHGKYIRITLNGSKVELDKTILESLTDPLTHLIRNSCDHGIESPEERTRAGKPETGHITLGAWHEAGHINIEIRDDGRGINPDIIRQKALEKRLKTVTELNRMSDNEILRLILLPGFSTADKVSELSGRGVGMDVVKTGIEKLGGIIDLESAVGEGTGIHLRLPLTLAIIPCLIVISGEDRYAIPQVNLVELVCLYDEDVHTKIEIADNQEVYRLRDRLLHMVRFSEVLARPAPFATEVVSEIIEKSRTSASAFRAGPEDQEASLNFAVLKVGTGRFGLIIDHVLGTEEIVVKPMHPALKSLNIYSGATVMGDGKVALILDIEGIAAHAGVITGTRADELHTDTVENDDDLQTVLLFKYGEKEHFAMTLPLIRRIERISTFHIEEIGEKEFITINNISTRILRLDQVLDVSTGTERDGMFLILPRYIRRPVGLLASRLVDIEETSVQLNTESYMEDGIMGTSVIRGHITLFIDIYRLIEKVEPEWFADRRMGLFGMPGPPDKELLAHNESEKRVLLVEDASFFRQLIKSYLEADGYEVITAENGKIGLERINETSFKLVVSDIEMPVMDGWNFVKHLRGGKRQQNIPTVALTALDSENDREKAKRCGFDRYEVKIDRERFLTTVAELMGRMKSEV